MGRITFSVAAHPPDGATTPGERDVIVRVRDLGAGIARDQPDPIFARFHRIPQGASHDFAEARRGIRAIASLGETGGMADVMSGVAAWAILWADT